jgi:O-antigen/teichoic acid export membrane protein
MPVEQYAQFGVAFAFQSTVAMLADLGFTSSIIALAGERAKDPEIMGLYIRSAKHYRRILVITVGLGFRILISMDC